MLRIRVTDLDDIREIEHDSGPLEFGRGSERDVRRITIIGDFVSRDQLRIEELPGRRLRVENLSQTKPVRISGGRTLAIGTTAEYDLPLRIKIRHVQIEIQDGSAAESGAEGLKTIIQPVGDLDGPQVPSPLRTLGDAPPAETLVHWLETVVALNRSAVEPDEILNEAAQALVNLVGLDIGLVLLRQGQDHEWTIVARHASQPGGDTTFSRTLVNHVVGNPRTFYQDLRDMPQTPASLCEVFAAVVSPIMGLKEEVVGLLYGVRNHGPDRNLIRPLEAHLVQLLAGAVGTNLLRAAALRTRVQFEQFFSPELARALERNPDLLEGRDQEVTILASDLRGYTDMAQRLGAQSSCRLVRDMMERLSARINEHGGVIVDYAGDGILAMWNAPVPQLDHAARAARTALAMLAELPELNSRWQSVVGQPLALGIGLNSGVAQVGNTGSSRKFKYGPHGHIVNLASRVQNASKSFDAPILMTAATQQLLPATFHSRPLGPVQLAGVAGEIPIYALSSEMDLKSP